MEAVLNAARMLVGVGDGFVVGAGEVVVLLGEVVVEEEAEAGRMFETMMALYLALLMLAMVVMYR